MAYGSFASFYDQIMGDRGDDTGRISGYLKRYLPQAATLLELGCGTGALLSVLASDLAVTGIDQSPQMLARARANVPQARLIQADMTRFAIDARFDVVICIFDTLNHLQRFESWRDLFDRVHEHLTPGGLFIFDVNTTGRMHTLWRSLGFALDFGPHTVIMQVSPLSGAFPDVGELSDWEVKIFEHVAGDQFRLHYESIPELAVPLATIREALAPHFEPVTEEDLDGGIVGDDSERVYFVYRHRVSQVSA